MGFEEMAGQAGRGRILPLERLGGEALVDRQGDNVFVAIGARGYTVSFGLPVEDARKLLMALRQVVRRGDD